MKNVIYKATNLYNGKSYIGYTTQDFDKRCKRHIYDSKTDSGFYFHKALRKYDLWDWEIIDHCYNIDDLKQAEIMHIKRLDTISPNGYNLTIGGDGCYGYKHSAEIKEKISNINKGKKLSEETKIKISEAKKGKKLSKAHRINIGLGGCGKKISEETKIKMSKAQKGKKLSKAHIKNMSKSKAKRWFPNATFKKSAFKYPRHWVASIGYNGKYKYLGSFHDPISCKILHDFVFEQIYGEN